MVQQLAEATLESILAWSGSLDQSHLQRRERISGRDDVCGDQPDQPNDPACPPPKKGGQPVPGKKSDMEAYARPFESYSRIIFCNRFFNNLISLTDATKRAKSMEPELQDHLTNWNNRARTLFHEITHLAYFMNSPQKSPVIEDAYITYKQKGSIMKTGHMDHTMLKSCATTEEMAGILVKMVIPSLGTPWPCGPRKR